MTTIATRPKTTGERPAIVGLLWMDGSPHRWVVNVATWLAAALMVASGVIHLHLWDIAYRHVPTIGPMFIAQGVAAIAIARGLRERRHIDAPDSPWRGTLIR